MSNAISMKPPRRGAASQNTLLVRRPDDLVVPLVVRLVQVSRGGRDVRVPRRVLQGLQLYAVVGVVRQHAVAQPVGRGLAQAGGVVEVALRVGGARGVGEDRLDRFGRRFIGDAGQLART